MPTPTYTALANKTLTSAATGVTFASIPSTYDHLVVVVQANADSATTQLRLRLNGTTGSIYSRQRVSGDGATATAASVTNTTQHIFGSTADITTTLGFHAVIDFLDYSATNKHKFALARAGNSSLGTDAFSARWASTAAITSIEVYANLNLAAGSTFALYGIVG